MKIRETREDGLVSIDYSVGKREGVKGAFSTENNGEASRFKDWLKRRVSFKPGVETIRGGAIIIRRGETMHRLKPSFNPCETSLEAAQEQIKVLRERHPGQEFEIWVRAE